jgi:4-amino-4-deoxy-L-arabinose transferase-like glycosyltransferase
VLSFIRRQDIVASAVLAIVAFGLFSCRASEPPPRASERPLNAAVDLLTAHHGHDASGRFLPLFIEVSSELWVPPVAAYATLAGTAVHGAEQPSRQVAALFGALGIALVYVFAAAMFRRRPLAWLAALLLLTTPAYVTSARSGTLDGVWVIPSLVLGLIAVARFVEHRSHRSLALGAAAFAVCAYTQPSGAYVGLIAAASATIGVYRAGLLTRRDLLRSVGAAAAVAMPIALWFAVYPRSYFDTFGRWFLFQAYIRHPWSLVVRMGNYFSLTEWGSIYWSVLNPTHLFYDANGRASAGTLLMPLALFIAAAIYDLARPHRPRTAHETALLWTVAIGFIASPLVPASFDERGAIEKALSLSVFGIILSTLGVRACWTRGWKWVRTAVILLLGLALIQFGAFFRALVITRS